MSFPLVKTFMRSSEWNHQAKLTFQLPVRYEFLNVDSSLASFKEFPSSTTTTTTTTTATIATSATTTSSWEAATMANLSSSVDQDIADEEDVFLGINSSG